MKTPLHPRAAVTAIWLTVLLAFATSARAAAPDLTAAGVIATINRSATYNLGATGLRGWIYLSGGAGNTHGADGTMTGESRQILVTVASAPGNAVLAVDDVILGAMAANSGTVPVFTSDARKAFGAAIGDAEKTGAGTLRVKRWRAGTITDENISMTIMGDYTATAPYNCDKSQLILANARNKLVSLPNASILTNDWAGAINGLALLAGVPDGDPNFATVQTRLQTYARARATAGPQPVGLPIWDWAYSGLFLAEYYLATGDANVLPGINSYTLKLAQSQSINGTFGHGPSVLRPDGSGRRVGTGYGPVNAVGIVANIAIVMGKKALLAGGQAIDPEIDGAMQRGSDFFAFYVNKGPIPYGEHEPFISGHSSNGKDPMCAVLFGLQTGRAAETEYYSRMTIASYNGREYGHTGQGFSYLWSAMGANMGGALAVAEYLKPVRWHLDLSRRTDGSFAYDGAEQFGGGSTSDGTYLGTSGYYGLNATASYLLTYSLPLQRLYITGKRDIPANPPPLTLDAPTVAHAVAAASVQVDSPGFTTAQLITSLSDFDPVVRHYAAIELGKRTLSGTDLTTLRNMVTGTNANGRMGACQALGLLKDSTALPTIVSRLDKTTETDPWVRAKAASAIRSYTPATASTHRDTMLTAFTANATNPDVIVWSDPIQMSNNFLSLALFGDAIYGGGNIRDYTVGATKNLLYPAVQTGLKQPDSYSRSGASRFCFDKLPLADIQTLMPDFFKVIEIECLADRMWSADSRANGIKTLSKYKVSEGIPHALAMLDIPAGFEWGSDTTLIAALNALAAYGDAARWTLPTLRGYLGKWSPTSSSYTTLVSTIASIEGAITAPVQAPGLAVANSQVASTTGAKAITLTGSSPRSSFTFSNVTAPAHGTLTGTAPNLTYTPDSGYTGPDFFTFQVIDSLGASYPSAAGTVSVIVGTAGSGLKGEYFDNIDFTNLKLTRTDAQVNFDWSTGSPNAALGADTFSVRWDGLLLVPETGTYTFSTLNSDGVRLYVNGVLLIDDYSDQGTNWKDGATVNLTAGQMVDLHLRYYENTGSAVAKLKWTGPSFAGDNGAIIGSQWLFDGTGFTRTPYAHSQGLSMIRNTPQPITLTGSGGTLTYAIVTPPAHGTLTGTAPNLTYTPATNYSGTDSFTFLVNNGSSNSSPATISIGIWQGQPVDFNWATAVSGSCNVGTSWTGGIAPDAAGQPYYRVNFTPSGTYTATQDLNSGFVFNQLNFSGVVTIGGTNSLAPAGNGPLLPQINQNSGNAVTVSVPVNLTTNTTIGGTGAGLLTLTGLISGPGGLTKDGLGGLRVHGYDVTAHTAAPNTFSGGTTINKGTLIWGTMDGGVSPPINAALGSGPVTINPGGILQFERVDTTTNTLICNGGTVFSNNGWGAKWGGPVTLNAETTVDATWNMTFNGNISGAGGLTMTGGRIVTLSGTNSFTGSNKLTEGTLTCTKAAALGTGTLDISTGAIVNLNYTGTRTIAALTYNGGSPLAPGTYGSTSSSATNKNNTYFSGTGTITILPSTTTTLALTSGTTPAEPGTPLTVTATVTGSSPTGSVAFYDGSLLLGSGALNGSFQATFTTSGLAIGSHEITANYTGNASNSASTSTTLTVVISSSRPTQPDNLLAVPGNNQAELSWTLSGGADSYYVKRSLTNSGPYSVIGNPTTGNYTDATALNGTTYYYVVSAVNTAGESTNSNQVTVVPSLQPTTTTLASSPAATGVYGSSVTFTATVSVSGTPATGTVTFRDGSTLLGSGSLSADTATFSTSTLAAGNHSITATYEGEGNYASSVSAPLVFAVTPKPLTITGVTASGKVYDGTTTATLSGGTISGGLVGSDTVTMVSGSGVFSSANVGTWTVTATGYSLGGAYADNYALSSQPTVTNASITARPIQLTGTRAYDGTDHRHSGHFDNLQQCGRREPHPGRQCQPGRQGRRFSGDSVRLRHACPDSERQRQHWLSRERNDQRHPRLRSHKRKYPRGCDFHPWHHPRPGLVHHWRRRLLESRFTGCQQQRITTEIWYGPNVSSGTTAISISQASLRSAAVVMEYSGLLAPASFDLAANSTNNGNSTSPVTGTTTTTTQSGELWIGGIGIASSAPTLGSITNSFTTVDNAVTSNGTAGNNARIYALERMVSATGTASSGGTITSTACSGAIATFKASPTLPLSGSAAGNYTLAGVSGSVAITPKILTTSGLTANNRPYNGTSTATLTGTAVLTSETPGSGTASDGKSYTGDTLTLGGAASGSFADKHAGTSKAITVSGLTLSGAQAGNYTLAQPAGLTANISALPVTVAAVNASKTYDGTPTASGTPSITPSLAVGDTTSALSQSFQTPDAGTGNKVIIPAITIDDGNNGANYVVTLQNYLSGTISPAAASITLGNLAQIYNGSPRSATAVTDPTGKTVNFTYNGSTTAPTAAGSYAVVGTINDINYSGSESGTLVISKAAATVTLGSLAQTYNGLPRSATAVTDPAGKAVDFTYNGSTTAPTAAGSYAVIGTINDINYSGSESGTLVISKAAATLTLGSLAQIYNGSPRSATAVTDPAGKTVEFTYNGSTTAPTAAGSYAVIGTINDINYSGSESGTLVISKAAATLTLGNLAQTYNGTPRSATATTDPSRKIGQLHLQRLPPPHPPPSAATR